MTNETKVKELMPEGFNVLKKLPRTIKPTDNIIRISIYAKGPDIPDPDRKLKRTNKLTELAYVTGL